MSDAGLREALAKVLTDNAVDDPANQGLHGWRCQYPERYGPCDCVDRLLDDLCRAALSRADAEADGLGAAWAEVVAALPEDGAWSVSVRPRTGARDGAWRWEAWAQDLASTEKPPIIRIGEGVSEEAALRALAARLAEQGEQG